MALGQKRLQPLRSKPLFLCHKNACQLEGSDHGGRDSAAELALAGTIDVQCRAASYNRLTLGPAPPDARNYTPRQKSVNGFLKEASLGQAFIGKSIGLRAKVAQPLPIGRGSDTNQRRVNPVTSILMLARSSLSVKPSIKIDTRIVLFGSNSGWRTGTTTSCGCVASGRA